MSQSAVHPVLVAGEWRPATPTGTFTATNPKTRQPLTDTFPVSGPADLEAALVAATTAAAELRALPNAGESLAAFLDAYATGIEANADAIVASAQTETGLPEKPRLRDVELPRTTGQLRQAAAAARAGDWQRPIVDTKINLRSCLAPIGPVLAIGPNNFPYAYNGIAGGDFAAALAAGNPVIAKSHPLHPNTSRLFAEIAKKALDAGGLPAATVQMIYHVSNADGLRLVADPRLKAVGFTGSRRGGLALKASADAAGTLFFGEMSSLNPTVLLPGAIAANADAIADQYVTSLLAGAGQFCTKPGLLLVIAGPATDAWLKTVCQKTAAAPVGTLFSAGGQQAVCDAIDTLKNAGAELVVGGTPNAAGGFGIANTLLRVTARQFLADAHAFQTEAFGNAGLVIVSDDIEQLTTVVHALEGQLTGSIYSAAGVDDSAYAKVAAALRPRVGRLINDKMPTGVAVAAAMNHGGPFPATSQPHFTAVGMPTAIARFTQLESYDAVREQRLPPCLRDKNPTGKLWRQIDGNWTQGDV